LKPEPGVAEAGGCDADKARQRWKPSVWVCCLAGGAEEWETGDREKKQVGLALIEGWNGKQAARQVSLQLTNNFGICRKNPILGRVFVVAADIVSC